MPFIEKMSSHVQLLFNFSCDCFEPNSQQQKHYSEDGRNNCGCCSLLSAVVHPPDACVRAHASHFGCLIFLQELCSISISPCQQTGDQDAIKVAMLR